MGLGTEEGDMLVHRVVTSWRDAPLSATDQALCDYASALTHKQGTRTEADLDRLRRAGLSDRAIHDAVQVIGFFNYITRVADGLGVELEGFIPSWGLDE